jgi:hypothetical protein
LIGGSSFQKAAPCDGHKHCNSTLCFLAIATVVTVTQAVSRIPSTCNGQIRSETSAAALCLALDHDLFQEAIFVIDSLYEYALVTG